MDPSHNNFETLPELPSPQERAGQPLPESMPTPSPERRGTTAPKLAPSSGQTAQPPAPDPLSPTPIQTPVQPASTPDPGPSLIADDADLIEKEWVMRAKAIVMHTKDDPHAQNREMNKVKADYLKKRYNKDLKVSEG